MLGIKKLYILIIKQFLLLFVGTFFISLFVLMMQFIWQYVEALIGKGLTIDILGQFFWYMALMMVPQALPLAILLSSLITFGNLGESSELTAIKAAGISLMQTLRPLAVIAIAIACGSFYFQNNIGPYSKSKIAQLLISMKQKSPELEIPEGVFYDGIPQCNIYVQKKDLNTGMLYGVMIYKMTESYEDAAIILADSGMLQSTAEKKHLLLTLYSGEWFENMNSSEFGESATIPYRRETFWKKRIVLDFDGDFNLADAQSLSQNAQAKSLNQIREGIDSLNHTYDSIGRAYFNDAKRFTYNIPSMPKADSLRSLADIRSRTYDFDTLYAHLDMEKQRSAVNNALTKVNQHMSELDFKGMLTQDGDYMLRMHKMEALNKFVLSLSCVIFFFIGAPLGAIIRKGGLGVPIIVSVLVFIVFYILDNAGYRMARGGIWSVWFGKSLATAVLAPTAVFFTYKANNDSAVFNLDSYINLGMRILGMRRKRSVMHKEVIINDPDYRHDAEELSRINDEVTAYSHDHNLKSPPNIIKVFFKYQPDNEIERISEELEAVIEDLSNTRDRMIITLLGHYPVVSEKAHTRPFERRWLNILSAILIPLGAFLYIRMWVFRLRLLADLRKIKQTNTKIISRIQKKGFDKSTRHSTL
jgi:lipopolysaccharide export system permease protein